VAPSVGSEFLNVSLLEMWTHVWSPTTAGYVSGGVDWLRSRLSSAQSETSNFYPNANVGVSHTIRLGTNENIVFRGGARLAVTYDPILQVAEPTLGAFGAAGWATLHVGTNATVEATTTIPTDASVQAARQVGGGLTEWYAPTQVVRFEVGARAYWQDLGGPVGAPGFVVINNDVQWTVFLAVVVQLPPIAL
jgi:hypothetical protein